MRKILVILLLTLLVAGCSKREGLKTVSNGWDVTLEGRVYQYRCEPDGFYLYINWDGEESYKMEFLHHVQKDRSIEFKEGDLPIGLQFLSVNNKGQHVYFAEYRLFDERMDGTQMILLSLDNDQGFAIWKDEISDQFYMLKKYACK